MRLPHTCRPEKPDIDDLIFDSQDDHTTASEK